MKDRLCEQIFQICHEKEKNEFFSMNIIFLKSSWHMLKAIVSMGCHQRWTKMAFIDAILDQCLIHDWITMCCLITFEEVLVPWWFGFLWSITFSTTSNYTPNAFFIEEGLNFEYDESI